MNFNEDCKAIHEVWRDRPRWVDTLAVELIALIVTLLCIAGGWALLVWMVSL
jgi:hypothetical protein